MKKKLGLITWRELFCDYNLKIIRKVINAINL